MYAEHTDQDYGCLNGCIIEYYPGYMRYLYYFLSRVGSSVRLLLEICYSVLLNVNSSFGIVSGVTRFIWCPGLVATMATPHRNFEYLRNSDHLYNFLVT